MFWIIFPLLMLGTSCASIKQKPLSELLYVPPAHGPQMDLEAMRDSHLDRLR